MIIGQIVIFILTFFASALILGGVLKNFFQKPKKLLNSSEITILSLGFGPALISLLLYFLLLFSPHKTDSFYIIFISAIYIVLGLAYRRPFKKYSKEVWSALITFKKRARFLKLDILLMGLLALAVGIYIFVQAVGYPILSNDGSTYGAFGRYFYEQRSLDNFPMETADEKTGFYFSGAQHPPGLHLLYTWFYMVQGNTSFDGLLRIVSPMYALYLVLLLWLILKERAGNYAGMFGVLLMALTPLVVWQAYENSIDPIRMFFIFASFVLLAKFLQKEVFKLVILLGASAGLALYTHAAGILALMVIVLVYLLLSRANFRQRIKWVFLMAGIALIFGGTQYGLNFLKFKNVLGQSSYHITDVKVKGFYRPAELEWQGQSGTILLTTKTQIPKDLIFGRLQVFSRPELFGLSYYIFVFAVIYWLRKMRKLTLDKVMLLGVILCAVPIIYKFYVNRRYILTVHPMVVYFGGLMLGSVYENLKKKKWTKWFWLGFLIVLLAALVVYFLPSSISSVKLKSGGEGAKKNYLLSSKREQNQILSSGLFEALNYLNTQTPPESIVLTYDNGRYYYYAQRYGIYWREPRMQDFYSLGDKMAAYQYLRDLGIDYLIIDQIYNKDTSFKDSYLKEIVEDQKLSKLVFEGDTRVYQLIK